MLAVPTTTPVIRPEPDTAVAIPVLALLQLPPAVESDNVAINPAHTFSMPETAAGSGLTVTGVTVIHPVPNV